MKINFSSLSSKLVLIGLAAALIPLCVVGYIGYSKSKSAVMEISMNQVQDVAKDLSRLIYSNLDSEMKKAASIANQRRIMDMSVAVEENGISGSADQIAEVFSALRRQFPHMGKGYQGIFITDTKGLIYTGILENGEEYSRIDLSKAPVFSKVKTTKAPLIDELRRSAATGELVTSACAPITSENGLFLGALGLVIKADYLSQLVSDRKIGKTGYGYMINSKGIAIAHPNTDHILKTDVTQIPDMAPINKPMLNNETGVEKYRFQGIDKIAGFAPVGINGWSIAVTQDESEFLGVTTAIRNAIFLVAAVTGILICILVLLAARTITRPINAAVAGLKDIATGEGDLTMRLAVETNDEIGELARWFNSFLDKLQEIIRQITNGIQTLASASTQLSAISEQMSKAAQDTSERATGVASASEEMSTSMNTVASAMEESATNTQTVATAAEQMSATVNEIAGNSERARTISNTAARQAAETSGKMAHLGSAAQAIDKVVETITDISDQVNLLALNATIEAARAGEAGKGFAVVANEIKDLARQTAQATQDIKEKIATIQDTTVITVKDIDEITKIITEVNEVVSGIATAVEEQSAVTSEIATNVSQAAQGIQQVNVNVGQSATVATEISSDIGAVSTTAGEISTSSEQVHSSAGSLSKLAEELKTMVGQFKI